jgi:hypothetical protein
MDIFEAIVEVTGSVVGKVACDDGKIVRGAIDEVDETVGEPFDAVEMKVGNLEQPKTVEGRREIGQRLVARDGADVEAVGASAGGETGDGEDFCNDTVDGDDALDGERAFALVDEARAQVGLGVQPTPQQIGAEAAGQRTKVDGVDVL